MMSPVVDHAAMVLRFDIPGKSNNDIYLIESTGKLGVSLKKWSNLRPHLGTFFNKIVIRHLEYDRDSASIKRLEHFLQEVNGAKYGLRPSQLMRKNTVTKKTNEKGLEQIDKDRTFFCSELVAKAYKMCEIMQPTEMASSNFLPGDFSEKAKDGKLQLV